MYIFTEVNKAFYEMTKINDQNIIGKKVTEVIPGIRESEFNWIEFYGNIAITGESKTLEQFSDVLNRWYLIQVFSHKKGYFTTIFSDITAKKEQQINLQDSENNFRTFFNSIDDFLFVLDSEGIIINVNKTVTDRLDYNEDELLGKSVLLLHPEQRRAEALQIVLDMLKGKADYCPVPLVTKKGEYIQVETRVFAGEWNSKPALFGVSKDINNIKQIEEKFTKAFQAGTSLMAISEIETGKYINVNDAFLKTTGYTINEVIGKSSYSLNIFSDVAQRKKIRKIVNENGEANNIELTIKTKNGSLKTGLFSISKLKLDDKECWLTVFVDITDQKKAEEELKKQTGLLTALLDSIPDLIFFKDVNGVYLGSNPSFSGLVDKNKSEIPGKTDYDLFPHDLADFFRENDRKMLSEKRSRRNEEEVIYPDGHKVILDTLKTPYKASDGSVIGVLGISRDITEAKIQEDKIKKSEELLSHAMNITNEGIWEWHIKTNKVNHNLRWCEILGFDEKILEHQLDFFTELIHNEDRDLVLTKINKSIKNRNKYFSEHRMIRADGSVIWIQDRGAVVEWDENGDPVKMIGSIADITEEKNHHNTLKLLVEMAKNFINMPIEKSGKEINKALMIMGEFVDADRAYIFDYDFPDRSFSNTYEWCNKGITAEIDKLQNCNLDFIPDWIEAHKKGQNVFIYDISKLPEGGQKDALTGQNIKSLLVLPIKNSDELFGFVGFDSVRKKHLYTENEYSILALFAELLVNVQERIQIENSLKEAKEAAESANTAKSEFLANMSHEIRTPMNAILGYSELLAEFKLEKTALEYLKGIRISGDNLLKLINNILDLSKIESNKLEIQPDKVNLQNWAMEIINIFSISTRDKGLKLSLDYKDDGKLVLTDGLRLKQIVINLLGNALKFTEEGEVKLKINRRDQPGRKCNLIVSVIDTGIGIPDKEKVKIFKAFTQKEGQSTRKYGGTGLGLTISKRLVQLMQGTIRIFDNPGGGTIFEVKFEDLDYFEEDGNKTNHLSVKNACVDFKGAELLLVEDVRTNRTVIKAFLSKNNVKITEAENGVEALSILKNKSFDLILMDEQMPEMDGIETIKRIKEQDSLRHIPILGYSASVLTHEQKRVTDICEGFIQKPVKKQELINILKDFLPYEESFAALSIEKNIIYSFKKIQDYQEYSELKKLYLIVNDLLSIDDIENFAEKLEKAAKLNNDVNVRKYADKLKEYCQHFEIQKAENDFKMLQKIFMKNH